MTDNPSESKTVDSAFDILLTPSTTTSARRSTRKQCYAKILVIFLGAFFVILFLLWTFYWSAPHYFPVGSSVTISKGMSIDDVSTLLAEQKVVRSPFWFKACSVLLGGNGGLKAGEYYFSNPLSVFAVAHRLTAGIQNLVSVTVTVPEGLSNAQIATRLSKAVGRFNASRFLVLGREKEGFLFPDTYVFQPNEDEGAIIAEMEENFSNRTSELADKITSFGKSLHEVITMASLIEGEARTSETRKKISGILWHRLELGMPLQVDAVFPYIMGKNTYEITADDLKIDSPYNTYRYSGLPPGPISNPGLDSIIATLTPEKTNYLYYLSDKDGGMHYAVTYAEHLVNREKYLNK